MGSFGVIFKHYMKRTIRNRMNTILLFGLPLGIILINLSPMLAEGINLSEFEGVRFLVIIMTLSFQFFGSAILSEYITWDFRNEMKWRLMSAPVSNRTILMAISAVSFIMCLLPGVLVLLVMGLIFGVDLGYITVLIPVMILVCVIAILLTALLVLVVPRPKLVGGIHLGACFVIMFLSGGLIVGISDLPAVLVFFQTYGTPVSLGVQAVMHGGDIAIRNIGILGVITAVAGLIVFAITRKKALL